MGPIQEQQSCHEICQALELSRNSPSCPASEGFWNALVEEQSCWTPLSFTRPWRLSQPRRSQPTQPEIAGVNFTLLLLAANASGAQGSFQRAGGPGTWGSLSADLPAPEITQLRDILGGTPQELTQVSCRDKQGDGSSYDGSFLGEAELMPEIFPTTPGVTGGTRRLLFSSLNSSTAGKEPHCWNSPPSTSSCWPWGAALPQASGAPGSKPLCSSQRASGAH